MATTIQQPPARFSERIKLLSQSMQDYYAEISAYLNSYKSIKCRQSARCESYRKGKKLLAKLAIGGKTLKVYLALDKTEETIARINVGAKDLSGTKAYVDVPYMMIIRSELAAKKACIVITQLMSLNNIPKNKV